MGGVLVSVVLTLYVVPCFYAMLAGRTRPANAVSRAVQALRKRHPTPGKEDPLKQQPSP